ARDADGRQVRRVVRLERGAGALADVEQGLRLLVAPLRRAQEGHRRPRDRRELRERGAGHEGEDRPAGPGLGRSGRRKARERDEHARYRQTAMAERHFVKYTFLKMDPAWRRLPTPERSEHKREFLAACRDFGLDHLLQSFSLIGTRGDVDLMIVAEAENLDRIHEFHVVLGQAGLVKWATQPYSFLGLRKTSEYSDERREQPRAFHGKYLFVYPFIKTRPWYALPAAERGRIMADHI